MLWRNIMKQLKILVVDDEDRMRKLVRDFLVRKQYEVVEASNGEEAVDVFVESNDIDLIISSSKDCINSCHKNSRTERF